MAHEDFEYKDFGLKNAMKLISENKSPMARVGILGNGTRNEGEITNATIGAKHEFGEDGMPVRSFLRMPISENMQKYLVDSGALSSTALEEAIRTGNFENFVRKIGVLSETIVLDAFASGGFGKWKPSDMEYKKNKETLVETQQLRNSITSDVQE